MAGGAGAKTVTEAAVRRSVKKIMKHLFGRRKRGGVFWIRRETNITNNRQDTLLAADAKKRKILCAEGYRRKINSKISTI